MKVAPIPTSPQSPIDAPSWTPKFSHLDNLLQLAPALNLLLQNVRDSIPDKHARIFGRQVLDIAMDFLYGLLLDGLEVGEKITEPQEKEDINKATGKALCKLTLPTCRIILMYLQKVTFENIVIKEKLVIMINFFFFHNVFQSIQ